MSGQSILTNLPEASLFHSINLRIKGGNIDLTTQEASLSAEGTVGCVKSSGQEDHSLESRIPLEITVT